MKTVLFGEHADPVFSTSEALRYASYVISFCNYEKSEIFGLPGLLTLTKPYRLQYKVYKALGVPKSCEIFVLAAFYQSRAPFVPKGSAVL